MAYGEYPVLELPFPTELDLSTSIYAAVRLSAGKIVLSAPGSVDTIGFLQNKPDGTAANTADGQACTVMALGVTRVRASAAIAEGAQVAAAASAQVATAVGGDVPLGRALEAASAAGQVISILITPGLPALP